MQLSFTKGTGKLDRLIITRADGSQEQVDCPKQGMIPHDMVHFAVESVLHGRGFLAAVQKGAGLGFTDGVSDQAEAIERLVETMQADCWSMGGRTDVEELLGLYELACTARDHATLAVSPADIADIRARMAQLADQWRDIPVGGTLSLIL